MTNPIEIIKRDHRKVEKLFKEYEELGDNAFETKKEIVEKLISELRLHTEMEEKFFYPKMRDKFSKEDDKMVEEAYAEHDVAKRILEELSVTHVEDPQFDARVKVLNENIAHHVMEEEQELLPKAEEKFKEDELNTIGEEMYAFKVENGEEESGV
jgi:hemerythrin-like domain-containing protein